MIGIMAYQGYENAYRYRRRGGGGHGRAKKLAVLLGIVLLLAGIVVWLRRGVAGTLYAASEAQVRSVTASAVNEAVLTAMQWNAAEYDSLVEIVRDGEGNVLSIEANAQAVNLIARQTVALSMTNLDAACAEGVDVPLGAFTGIGLFFGDGAVRQFPRFAGGDSDLRLPLFPRLGGDQSDAAYGFPRSHRIRRDRPALRLARRFHRDGRASV